MVIPKGSVNRISSSLIGTVKLAQYLDVSINTVYFWVYQRKIPHYKIGKYVRFDPREIRDWLEDKKKEPVVL